MCQLGNRRVSYYVTAQLFFVSIIPDDVGVTNVDLKCTNNKNLPQWHVAEVSDWGTWDGWKKCEKNQAVCGIQTLVEEDVWKSSWNPGDNTALNDMNLFCCDIV